MFIKKKGIIKNQTDTTRFSPCDSVILYPALGCPALVQIDEKTGDAWAEFIIASKTRDIRISEIAFHLRYARWSDISRNNGKGTDHVSVYKPLRIYTDYMVRGLYPDDPKKMIVWSGPFENLDESFGKGTQEDAFFKIQLGRMNAYPWVLKAFRSHQYNHIYKAAVNLKYEHIAGLNGTLLNFTWMKKDCYQKAKKKPSFKAVMADWFKGLFAETYTLKLSEYGLALQPHEDVIAARYHPVYFSSKKRLSIGHVTDIHMDSRMDVYGQSVASVVEIKENCNGGLRFENNKRVVKNSLYYTPIKKLVANFNDIFMNISEKMLKKADVLVITGDLVDYNRGLHSEQTARKSEQKPSETWKHLKSDLLLSDNKDHKKDRNWFLFYKLLLQLYNTHQKPVFTMLGNHDYVFHATAPWPVFGLLWNGVYDQNLTRYENALCFGQGFSKDKEFVKNGGTSVDHVKWYTHVINPFPDYVINYGDQSLFMVDWGEKATFSKTGAVNDVTNKTLHASIPLISHPGSLHRAVHLFREQHEFEQPFKNKDGSDSNIVAEFEQSPFPIKNYTIYKNWVNDQGKVRMLFTHATTICPRDDISEGQIDHSYDWSDEELCYGTFEERRKEIIRDIENGKLHISVGGHSHRNVVMHVDKSHKNHVLVIAAGESVRTGFMAPAHLVMVSSSGGPLPKYKPGGPLICTCPGTYHSGYYYEWSPSMSKKRLKALYSAENRGKKELPSDHCPRCGMKGEDMIKKPARRHAPGGNLLVFEDKIGGKVRIETEITDLKQGKPRKAVMCEEQDVFTGDMVLEGIKNEKEYARKKKLNPIHIVSRKPFTLFGFMELPTRVQYITFSKGRLKGDGHVSLIKSDKQFRYVINQEIIKNDFDKLKRAAQNTQNFSFYRYSFLGNEVWDREIIMTKSLAGSMRDAKEEVKRVTRNTPEKIKTVYKNLKNEPYNPKLYKPVHDDFDGLLIEFKMIPDFKKRMAKDVCGY